MVRFIFVTIGKSYNCIVVKPELITVLLMLQDGKYNIAVEGHINKRKQLVVSDLTVRNPEKTAKALGL